MIERQNGPHSIILLDFYIKNLHFFTIPDRDKRRYNLRYLQLWTDSNNFFYLQKKPNYNFSKYFLNHFVVYLKQFIAFFEYLIFD